MVKVELVIERVSYGICIILIFVMATVVEPNQRAACRDAIERINVLTDACNSNGDVPLFAEGLCTITAAQIIALNNQTTFTALEYYVNGTIPVTQTVCYASPLKPYDVVPCSSIIATPVYLPHTFAACETISLVTVFMGLMTIAYGMFVALDVCEW